MLVVYADESGTNKDSIAPVIGGYIGFPYEWEKFCRDWPQALSDHNVHYFHFREWVDALESTRRQRHCQIKNNPYSGKDEHALKELLYDLAEIAGRHIPIGGMINLKNYSKVNKGYAFGPLFEWFIRSIDEAIQEHWPDCSENIEVFFDQTTDKRWKNAMRMAFDKKREKDKRYSEPTFRNKKIAPYLPLQAADMIAFWDRKKAEPRMVSGLRQEANLLDYMLNRNLRPNGFYPVHTAKLLQEVTVNALKFPSVMRAIYDKPRKQHGYQ